MARIEWKRWYENNLLVIILLFLFFPIGLYGLWKNTKLKKKIKIILTCIVAILFVIAIITNKEEEKIVTTKTSESKKSEYPSSTDFSKIIKSDSDYKDWIEIDEEEAKSLSYRIEVMIRKDIFQVFPNEIRNIRGNMTDLQWAKFTKDDVWLSEERKLRKKIPENLKELTSHTYAIKVSEEISDYDIAGEKFNIHFFCSAEYGYFGFWFDQLQIVVDQLIFKFPLDKALLLEKKPFSIYILFKINPSIKNVKIVSDYYRIMYNEYREIEYDFIKTKNVKIIIVDKLSKKILWSKNY